MKSSDLKEHDSNDIGKLEDYVFIKSYDKSVSNDNSNSVLSHNVILEPKLTEYNTVKNDSLTNKADNISYVDNKFEGNSSNQHISSTKNICTNQQMSPNMNISSDQKLSTNKNLTINQQMDGNNNYTKTNE